MISTFILWFELMGVWCVGLKFESRVAKENRGEEQRLVGL